MSSKAAMASIAARQQRELYLQEFSAAQAVESRQREAVNWEAKGRTKLIQRDLHRQLDKIQAQYRDTVVERRKRLVELLQREQESYDKMLECLTETHAQRRERLIRKAKDLREKREADKMEDLTNRNNRLFRDKIDCLRQAESRLKVMQVTDARFQQLAQAKVQKAEEEQDEIYFAHQAAENCRLANERAQRDLEDRYLRTKRLKEDLSAQVEGNLMRRKIAAEEQKRDTETFFQQLHEERVQEAQKQLARRDAREQMAAEMKALNEELERARKEEYDRLRQEDKELLDQILAEIAVEKQKSMEEKQARMMKEKAAYHDVQKQMSQHKEDEDALEKLWEEANQKEWDKREARWKADQTRRDQLMRNILIIRRQQVLDKHQQRREEAENRKQENAEIRAALARDDGTVAAEHQKRLDAIKENQRYLDAQISMRQAAKDAELTERRNALSSAEAMEACYHDRIQEEMANLEAAKPERYRHVPLLPPRQRDQPF